MKFKHFFLLPLSFALWGCGNTLAPLSPGTIDNADAALAEASYTTSRSISSLSETAQAAHPTPSYATPPNPAAYGMAALTSVDWSGPVEPLVRQIAQAADYHVRVLGTPPAIPVLVTLYDKNRPLADILSDIGYQCGRRATIVIYYDGRVIELRYAKN